MCLTLHGYRDAVVWIYEYRSLVNGNKEKLVTANFILILTESLRGQFVARRW